MHILYVVEGAGDPHLLRALAELGHRIETASAADGAEVAALGGWAVIVTDASEPSRLAALAAACPAAPLIAVGGPNRAADRIAAFRAGADAWMARPLSVLELSAKLEALTRARPAGEAATGRLTLNAGSRAALAGGRSARLTRQQYALLDLLHRRPGAVSTVEEILRAVWGDDAEPHPALAQRLVSELRKALAPLGAAARIETVRGHGYRLRP